MAALSEYFQYLDGLPAQSIRDYGAPLCLVLRFDINITLAKDICRQWREARQTAKC